MKLSEIASFCAHNKYGRLRVSEATYVSTYKTAARRLIAFFGDILVTAIKPADLLDWQEWLDSHEIAAATRNSYVRTVRAMWNRLRKRGIAVCETQGIFKFKKERKGVKSVKKSVAWRMLAATGIRDAAIIWLLMDSARRRSGLLSLKVDNVRILWHDELEEFYVVGQVIEKGEKPQLLMAYHEAAMVLSAWLKVREELLKALKVEDHGYVFVNVRTGEPMNIHTLSGLAGRLAMKANIPKHEPTNLHAFRHRAAKEMLKHLSLTEVRDILGHSDIRTTADQYAINSEEELMEAFFMRARKGRGKNREPERW